jgi:ketosteroid isomerase-like protein
MAPSVATPQDWLRTFEAAVRARDFAGGRELFATDAMAFGTWARAVVTGPDGRPITRPGRGTFVLERRGGKWLAVHSHFSLLPSQSETAHGRLPSDAARS